MSFSKLSFEEMLILLMFYSLHLQKKAGSVSKNHFTENTVLLQAHFMVGIRVFCTWGFYIVFWVLWATDNSRDLLSTYCILDTLHTLAFPALRALCIFHCNTTHSLLYNSLIDGCCLHQTVTSMSVDLYPFLFPIVTPALRTEPDTY